MKNLRKKLMGLMLASFVLILAACGPELPAESEVSGGGDSEANVSTPTATEASDDTLIMGMINSPASRNPFNAPNASDRWMIKYSYETLLDMLSPTEFRPRLAEITTEDNQNFTVKVKEGVTWTDGEPVTVDDVIYTINTIAHPDTLTSQGFTIAMIEGTDEAGKNIDGGDQVSGVTKIDDYTLKVVTKAPVDINYFSEFFGAEFIVAPEHVFSQYAPADIQNSEPAINPTVVNGAYEFVEYQEENFLHLRANENYHRGAPQIQEIFVRVIDRNAMVTELQAGNIHMIAGGGIGDVPHQDVEMLQQLENYTVEGHPTPNVHYVYFNHEDPVFADERVRQAFAYAFDFEMAVDNLMLGNGETLAGPYTSVNPYKSDEIEPYRQDQERAKQLLEEANFDFNQELVLNVPTGNNIREQAGDLIEQWLEQVGVQVRIEKHDFATHQSLLREGDYQMGLSGMTHNYDPEISKMIGTGGSNNYTQYSDPEMDELLSAGRAGTSFEERYPIYEQIQAKFKDEVIMFPMYSESVYTAQVNNLDGGAQGFWPSSIANLHEWRFTE